MSSVYQRSPVVETNQSNQPQLHIYLLDFLTSKKMYLFMC